MKKSNVDEKIVLVDKESLIEYLEDFFKKNPMNSSLNHLDVSRITDFSNLFSIALEGYGFRKFNGSLSEWDVSSATNMKEMFYGSSFNKDISKWNVSNVEDMSGMFAIGHFNQNISKWNVSKVKSVERMFSLSVFNQPISEWNLESVISASRMFAKSPFEQSILTVKWGDSIKKEDVLMFDETPIAKKMGLGSPSLEAVLAYQRQEFLETLGWLGESPDAPVDQKKIRL